MRYKEIIETVTTTNNFLYHGTSTTSAAKNIITHGIVPPEITTKGHMVPVKGKVYLTKDIEYATIYALGGSYLGSSISKDMIGTKGIYGYVFCVDSNDVVNPEPDEDSVGEFFGAYCKRKFERFNTTYAFCPENIDPEEIRNAERVWTNIKNTLTPNQIKKMAEGEYMYYASGGKRALKSMSNADKNWLINVHGAHLANDGLTNPRQCWRIDKRLSRKLHRDASNFFDIAKLVWENNAV